MNYRSIQHFELQMIWDFVKCCYSQRSNPLISNYFAKVHVWSLLSLSSSNTPRTPSWRLRSCQMGLTPSSLLFLGCSRLLLLHDLTLNSPLQIFLAAIKWPLQPSSWHLSATNHNVLQRDVSWRNLKEILGDLEGRTPISSNMISLLQVNCAFGRTYLCLKMNSH